ncbi:MAG: hypothetical protein AAAC47_12990 [Pararhizobium sp.]
MIFSRASAIAGAVFGGLAVFLVMQAVNALWVIPAAKIAGREIERAAQAAADRKSEIERKGDDAKLRSMPDYDLCVDGLRSRRLSIDACEQLRGLQP